MRISAVRLAAAASLALAALPGCGGGGAANPLHGRLLSVADLPAGWSATSTNPKGLQPADSPCFSGLPKKPVGLTYDSAAFIQVSSVPNVGEVVATGPNAQQTWQSLHSALESCRSVSFQLRGTKVDAAVKPLTFPAVAETSSAYAWSFTYSGMSFESDLVLFQTGTYDGYLSYSDLGTPPVATVAAMAKAAVAKATSGSTAPVGDTLSITSTPVQTAPTKLGTVAYRAIGTGPPLVMITGYSGTMEGWDRRFVDALAEHHHVVIFDNAGVGRTQALPAPLTIDAMANQTSALIDALSLKQPDVLGWSMGSMIAQALAVLHPGDVHHLILCAGYPGTGAAVPPPRATLDAFESGDPQKVMAALFPADQSAAQNSFTTAISSYPNAPAVPQATVDAQGRAVDQWWAAQDPGGRQTTTISDPTLVADGASDVLDPVANSQTLAKLIPGATLKLYPDAGHAFLFQAPTAVVEMIESFLS